MYKRLQPHREANGRRDGKRPRRPLHHQKHLYLVLDDWEKGFSIHKIDPAEDGADSGDANLGQPAVLRLASPVPNTHMFFAAVGSNILVGPNPSCDEAPTLVYDTHTSGLAVGPPLPGSLLGDFHLTFAVPGADNDTPRLYATRHHNGGYCLEVMSWGPMVDVDDDPYDPTPAMGWSWESAPAPLPFVEEEWIASHALHPDGRTIFMSSGSLSGRCRTFSLDTAAVRPEWRFHGEWSLPFSCQGFYDDSLDAWVGLRDDGHIYACEVPSRRSGGASPEWKMAKEKMSCKVAERRRVGDATLTYMGDARFCIVECVVRDGLEYEVAFGDRDGCVVNVTIFGLKYDRNGDLQIKHDRTTDSYVVSSCMRSAAA